MSDSIDHLLKINNVQKSFYDNIVLKDINLKITYGSINALCGENGAGKSTLMNIINGSLQQDHGEIFFKDKLVYFHKPMDAISSGIAFIPQEISFIPEFTVAETVFLGRSITKNKMLDYNTMNQETARYLALLELAHIEPTRMMKTLRLGEIQLVEIVRAISQDAELFIMDEPTTALTEKETDKLFQILQKITDKNKSIIFISHRMNEILQIADYIFVLRDGKLVLDDQTGNLNETQITSAMLGSKLEEDFHKDYQMSRNLQDNTQKILILKKIFNQKIHNIDLELNQGEIIGIFGLMGAGRTSLLETIFGALKVNQGEIWIKNTLTQKHTPKFMIDNGFGYVTEDRKHSGLFLSHSVLYNTIICSLNVKKSKYISHFITKTKNIKNSVHNILKKLNLNPLNIEKVSMEYSGGNQQKIVFGKWLINNPEILLLDEPTKGIDVIAKSQIYKFCRQYVQSGNSIILISSELPEIMLLSDRILIMKSGRIVDEQRRETGYDPKKLIFSAS